MALPFPRIDPVAIHLGPLSIRWYALAYMGGIFLGWWVFIAEHRQRPITNLTKAAMDDMVMYATLGILIGGRLGHVLFYEPAYFMQHPLEIFYVWQGGMSFHGGLLGFSGAFWLFCRKYHIGYWQFMDVLACCVPIGLGLGRLANFINGELYGRPTDVPWAMVFPHAELVNGENVPRHPSQLYEAGIEGVLLFALLMFLLKCTRARDKPGLLCGVFLIGYAGARMFAEYFRVPEGQVWIFTYGQFLCLPMIALGLYLLLRPVRALP